MQFPDKRDLDYRYAYQGQEKDDETGMEAFELRLWDSRIGRWLTPDPAGQYYSPYLGMGNNPISRIDPDGGKDGEGNGRGWLWRAWNKFKGGLGFQDKSRFSLGVGEIEEYVLSEGEYEGGTLREVDTEQMFIDGAAATVGSKTRGVIDAINNPLKAIMNMSFESPSAMVNNKMNAYMDAFINADAYSMGSNLAGDGFDATLLVLSEGVRFPTANLYPKVVRQGGRINGISIGTRPGYGAQPRFDIHPLRNINKSRKTSKMTIPKWLDGKSLPHYHRGKGNNLKYHRPWEIGPDGKRKW